MCVTQCEQISFLMNDKEIKSLNKQRTETDGEASEAFKARTISFSQRLQIVLSVSSLSFNNVVCQFDDLLPELGQEIILNFEPPQAAVLLQSSKCIKRSEPQH